MTVAEGVAFAVGGVLAMLAAVVGYRTWLAKRITPEERERQRRTDLVLRGKMGDALLLDTHDNFLFYAYTVRGVEYTASQDVSQLQDCIPPELPELEAVSVKYDRRNPANSIVVAEQWSGLRLSESHRNRG